MIKVYASRSVTVLLHMRLVGSLFKPPVKPLVLLFLVPVSHPVREPGVLSKLSPMGTATGRPHPHKYELLVPYSFSNLLILIFMAPFIYLNGYPGVGKLTIAKELS
jgi:hypothetical protein